MNTKLINPGILATIFVGLFGFILAYRYFHISQPNRDPVYAIVNGPQLVVDKHSANNVKISFDDFDIDENIYLATLVVWNAGNEPIETLDIRSPARIETTGNGNIFILNILEETDPGISEFKFEDFGSRFHQMEWKHFDPGFGVKIQLFYSGDEYTRINVSGKVLDANFREVVPQKPLSLPVSTMMVIFIVLIILSSYLAFQNYPSIKKIPFVKWALVALPILLSILTLLIIHQNYFTTYKPPL